MYNFLVLFAPVLYSVSNTQPRRTPTLIIKFKIANTYHTKLTVSTPWMSTRAFWTVEPDSLETVSSLSTVESKASCETCFNFFPLKLA